MGITPTRGLYVRKGCRVGLSADVTIQSSVTTTVAMNSLVFDDSMYTATGTRINILTSGRYMLIAEFKWAQYTVGYRVGEIWVNGTTVAISERDEVSVNALLTTKERTIICELDMTAGQYVDMRVWQSAGITTTLLASQTFLNVYECS